MALCKDEANASELIPRGRARNRLPYVGNHGVMHRQPDGSAVDEADALLKAKGLAAKKVDIAAGLISCSIRDTSDPYKVRTGVQVNGSGLDW